MRAAARERVPRDSFEKLLKRGREWGGQYVCDFGEAGVHAMKRVFFPEAFCQSGEAFCQSQGAAVTTKDFSALLDVRRCKN